MPIALVSSAKSAVLERILRYATKGALYKPIQVITNTHCEEIAAKVSSLAEATYDRARNLTNQLEKGVPVYFVDWPNKVPSKITANHEVIELHATTNPKYFRERDPLIEEAKQKPVHLGASIVQIQNENPGYKILESRLVGIQQRIPDGISTRKIRVLLKSEIEKVHTQQMQLFNKHIMQQQTR